MIDAAQAVSRFVARRTRADLDQDQMLLFAVVHAVQVLGEAASKVTPDTRIAHADIPWAAIVGMRNRLVHAYFDVDTELVWVAATQEIPALLQRLKAVVANADAGD